LNNYYDKNNLNKNVNKYKKAYSKIQDKIKYKINDLHFKTSYLLC
jgi:hypothetical protein